MKLAPPAGKKCYNCSFILCSCCLCAFEALHFKPTKYSISCQGEHISVEYWKKYRKHTVQYVLCPQVTLHREAGDPKQILFVQRERKVGVREGVDSKGQTRVAMKVDCVFVAELAVYLQKYFISTGSQFNTMIFLFKCHVMRQINATNVKPQK